MTIKINVADTLRAAKKAKDDGLLAAFNEKLLKETDGCRYDYGHIGFADCVCGVGAGISPEDRAKLKPRHMVETVGMLTHLKVFEIEGDYTVLAQLQDKHDNIITGGKEDRGVHRAAFTRFLNAELKKLEAA